MPLFYRMGRPLSSCDPSHTDFPLELRLLRADSVIMAATPSTMLALGTPAPAFTLPDVASGEQVSLTHFADKKALLVIFLCAHCPFVHHIRMELSKLGRDYGGKDAAIVGITSNDAFEYPDDAPEPTARFARESGISFPILYDETQDTARAYSAACTPDFFLFDETRKLVYRGQLDSTRPNKGVADGADLRAALNSVLAGTPVNSDQRPSVGCNIKWKR